MEFGPTTYTVSVYDLVKTGNKEAYNTVAIYTGIRIGIFPAGTDILAVYPGLSGYQVYEGFIYRALTIKNGYKFVSGTDEWIVRGVPAVYTTPLSYIHVVLEKVV